MLTRLFYCWRIVATGFAFSMFGVGGILLPSLAFVGITCWPGRKRDRRRRARYWVHRVFKFFVEMLIFLRLISLEVTGAERLNRSGQLIVANHPSLIDVVILIALVPNADCVIKRSLLRNPAMRWFLLLAGYIVNEGGQRLVDAASTSLAEGGNLIVFPEGTRSEGELGKFQRGCANIAFSSSKAITPVIINCYPPMLQKHNKWYQIPSQPGSYRLNVKDDIAISEYAEMPRATAVRRLTSFLENYFNQEWKSYEYRNIELRDSAVNY